MSTEQLERQLLELPRSERARLAKRLIASLEEEAEVDRAWLEEVRRRDRELESGAVEALPFQEFLSKVRSPEFAREAHLQSRAVAEGGDAASDQTFIDSVSELSDG